MSTNFEFTGDYKQKLIAYIEELEHTAASTSRGQRKQAIHELTNAYVKQTGRVPDGKALERLTNVLLHEELTDRRPDKITLEEYPILSDRQYELRASGKRRERRKDGTVLTEVPISHGVNVATDGVDYTPHKRSFNNQSPR